MNGPFSLCCHVCAGSPCAGQPQNKRSQRGTAHRAARRGWPGQPPPAGCSRCCSTQRPCWPGSWGDASHPAGRGLRADGHAGLRSGGTAARAWAACATLPVHSCTPLAGRRGGSTGLRPVQEVALLPAGYGQGPAAGRGSRLQARRSQRRCRWGAEAQPCHGQVWVSTVGLGRVDRGHGTLPGPLVPVGGWPCHSHQPRPGTVLFGD